ncbi:MAG TPA: preprotein translocase subunit YajC, partial [Firmicutes bacterium]|nr:preprotein translocase subunit YajC [Bacillota bacterium]
FYFFMIRPQQKQQKKRQEMLNAIGVGSDVVTIGGIHGKVTELNEDTVLIEVNKGMTLKMLRSAIGSVVPKEVDSSDAAVAEPTAVEEERTAATDPLRK